MSFRFIFWVALGSLAGCALPYGALAQSAIPSGRWNTYSKAEEFVRAHQWDEGLAVLRPLLKQDGSDLKVLNLAGLAYTGKGNLPEADRFFRKVLQIQPAFLPALKNLGINEFTLNETASSQKHLIAAATQSPADPVVNLFLGEIAYSQKRYQVASEKFDIAQTFVARDPNLRAAYGVSLLNSNRVQLGIEMLAKTEPAELNDANAFAAGIALANADQPTDAILYFEALRARYPNSYNIGFDLLLCYLRAKQAPEAQEAANTIIQSGHDTDEVESALAEAYEQSNKTPQAVQALRRAIELNPQNEDNYLDFANLCIDHRDLNNGLKVIGVGLTVLPNSSRLIFERGVLYAMQDRFDLAEQDFERSARLAPMTDFGYVGIGVTYMETGHAAQAVAVLRQRLKTHPNDASLLYLFGEALMRSGAQPGDKAYSEAQNAFERSAKLNPALCLPHVALGEIYVDEGRYKDAIVQLEIARSIDPKEKSAYSHLAVAYRKTGDRESAKRVLTDLKNLYEQEQGWLQSRIKSRDSNSAGPSPIDSAN